MDMQTASAVYTGPLLHRKLCHSRKQILEAFLKHQLAMEYLPFPLENPLYTLQDPRSAGKTCHIASEEMEDFVAYIPRRVPQILHHR